MDQDLVVRVQNGDQRAFEALATADYPRLFAVAQGVLSDRGLAEDVTQEALLSSCTQFSACSQDAHCCHVREYGGETRHPTVGRANLDEVGTLWVSRALI